MLSLLINRFKKILFLLLVGALLLATTTIGYADDFIRYSIVDDTIETNYIQDKPIIIRIGEYEGKAGKRVYLDDIGLHFIDIPSDIKIHYDNEGAYIAEYDLNKKIATRLYNELNSRGVNVILQDTTGRHNDLNAAGRLANKSNPYMYLSIHTNYYDYNSKGFFIMTNQGDIQSRIIADRLSASIANNKMIPCREAILNTGSIGELNSIQEGTIAMLFEAGFYSNPHELIRLMSDSYSDYIATHMSDEILKILK